MSDVIEVSQTWLLSTVALSYLISITGSFCTIQLMEQWRQYDNPREKLPFLVMASLLLGGCGIWCTHFTGMNALRLTLTDGTLLEIELEIGLTIVSFIFAVLGVFIGLRIASTDPFFLEVEQHRRKTLLVQNLEKTNMKSVVNKNEIARRIKLSALFSRLTRTAIGGFFAAIGVLGMHYLGMMAQRTNATMEFNLIVVGVSCLIAFVTATAAFWIIFRALTFWPNLEYVRFASALIMGVAVCGTHYTGMASASYTYSATNSADSSRFVLNITGMSTVSSHAAILLCYWVSSLFVTKSVKVTENLIRSRTDQSHRGGGNYSRADNARSVRAPSASASTIKKIYITKEHSSSLHA